jgi:DNA-binding FrmR family transcriptional regulator
MIDFAAHPVNRSRTRLESAYFVVARGEQLCRSFHLTLGAIPDVRRRGYTLRGYLRGDQGRQMPDHESHHGYIASKDDYLKRLRRIEGQARGLQKMIEEEQYCIDILTQVSAMTRALQSVALGLLDEHLSHCVVRAAAEGGTEAEIKIEEASNAIARLVRS